MRITESGMVILRRFSQPTNALPYLGQFAAAIKNQFFQ